MAAARAATALNVNAVVDDGQFGIHAKRLEVPVGGRVKVLGTRHAFNDIADTDGDHVSLERFDRVVGLDRGTVTLEAGDVVARVLGESRVQDPRDGGVSDDQCDDDSDYHGTGSGFFWYYLGAREDPALKGKRPDLKGHVRVPEVLIQAHSSALSVA